MRVLARVWQVQRALGHQYVWNTRPDGSNARATVKEGEMDENFITEWYAEHGLRAGFGLLRANALTSPGVY